MDLRDEAREVKQTATDEILSSNSLQEIESARVKHLGRKGTLTQLLRKLGQVEAEERKEVGRLRNEIKEEIESMY